MQYAAHFARTVLMFMLSISATHRFNCSQMIEVKSRGTTWLWDRSSHSKNVSRRSAPRSDTTKVMNQKNRNKNSRIRNLRAEKKLAIHHGMIERSGTRAELQAGRASFERVDRIQPTAPHNLGAKEAL